MGNRAANPAACDALLSVKGLIPRASRRVKSEPRIRFAAAPIQCVAMVCRIASEMPEMEASLPTYMLSISGKTERDAWSDDKTRLDVIPISKGDLVFVVDVSVSP